MGDLLKPANDNKPLTTTRTASELRDALGLDEDTFFQRLAAVLVAREAPDA